MQEAGCHQQSHEEQSVVVHEKQRRYLACRNKEYGAEARRKAGERECKGNSVIAADGDRQ